jgi:hypothetical protein
MRKPGEGEAPGVIRQQFISLIQAKGGLITDPMFIAMIAAELGVSDRRVRALIRETVVTGEIEVKRSMFDNRFIGLKLRTCQIPLDCPDIPYWFDLLLILHSQNAVSLQSAIMSGLITRTLNTHHNHTWRHMRRAVEAGHVRVAQPVGWAYVLWLTPLGVNIVDLACTPKTPQLS